MARRRPLLGQSGGVDALLKKLQYRGGMVTVYRAPTQFRGVLQAWQDNGVDVSRELLPDMPFVLVFVDSRAQIETRAREVIPHLVGDDPLLWFGYPKKSSKGVSSDVGRDDSWQPLGDLGFEPVRQVALDEDWSALRFRRPADIGAITRNPDSLLSDEGRKRAKGDA